MSQKWPYFDVCMTPTVTSRWLRSDVNQHVRSVRIPLLGAKHLLLFFQLESRLRELPKPATQSNCAHDKIAFVEVRVNFL